MWRKALHFVLLVCLMAVTTDTALEPVRPAYAATDTVALFKRAYKLTKAGKHAEALPIAERTRKLIAKQFGRKHQSYRNVQVLLAHIHNGLSNKFYKASNYAKAEKHAKQALTLREEALGKTYPCPRPRKRGKTPSPAYSFEVS